MKGRDVAKNNNQKLKLAQKQWDILHNFEDRQKKSFLMSLTKNEALKIFRDLYQFAESISGMACNKNSALEKANALAEVHSMFMKVNP